MMHVLGKCQMQHFIPRMATEYERNAKKKVNISIHHACKQLGSPT